VLASCIGDWAENGMCSEVSYHSSSICDIPPCEMMVYSTVQPWDNSRAKHLYWELMEDYQIDTLHTLSVRPIRNQFWQYPHCNEYLLQQADESHQQRLGLVEVLLHWLLK
jgi:hypothetical protein